LEDAPELAGRLRFDTGELSIRINDRLLAPNTAETFRAVKADIEAVIGEMFHISGSSAAPTLSHTPSDLAVFEVIARLVEAPLVSTVLSRQGVVATS
jgi:hypothetical protein